VTRAVRSLLSAAAVVAGLCPAVWCQIPAPPVTFSTFASGSSSSRDITAGADGNLWYTDPESPVLRRMTTSGSVTPFSVPGASGTW
jgi:hypothetical protein